MKVKKIITLTLAAAMSLSLAQGMVITVNSEEMTAPSKLVSVCYSPELDIYTAVAAKSADSGNNLITYSSGDGKHWVQTKSEIDDSNSRIGTVIANGHYINPNMIVWNDVKDMFVMGDMANVYTSEDGKEWELLGTPKKYENADGTGTSKNIELYNMYFDGTEYWATTRYNGEVAKTIDGDLLKWYAVTVDGLTKPFSSITGTDNGKIYLSSAEADKGAYTTKDNGLTWSLAIGANVGPYKTLGSIYSKYLDRMILVGVNGNKNTLDSVSAGSINFIAPATDTAPEGNKIELKNMGEDKIVPGPVGEVMVSEDGSDIILAFMNGDIYAVDTTVDDLESSQTPISCARKRENYTEVKPKTDADDIGTMPLTGITRGKDGYVIIGGTPGHSTLANSSAPAGVAAFVPFDYTQGYEKAVFYTSDTPQEATSAYIYGDLNEIKIANTLSTAQYNVIVRDQSGAAMENTGKTFSWSIKDEPTGVTISADGVLSVTSDAQPGYITIVATENDGTLVAEKKILITSEPEPASISIEAEDTVLVKSKVGERKYAFTAIVKDDWGRVIEDEEVEWKIEEFSGSGVAVDDNGVITVMPEAENGKFKLTAVSKSNSQIVNSIEFIVTSIAEVSIKGPSELNENITHLLADSLDSEGNSIDRTYTYTPTVIDSEEEKITGEECIYSIDGLANYNKDGVALSTDASGNAVITVSADTVSQKLLLTAVAANNDDVKCTYELNIIKSLVEDSGFRKGVGEDSGWTVVSGQVTAATSGGLTLMRMMASEDEEAIAVSDPFAVESGKTYNFGFRSKVKDGMSYNSSMYAMLIFCNADGEEFDYADVYDANIEGKKDLEESTTNISGHQTAIEFYNSVVAPEGAVTAYVMLGVTGPITNADFYDIGVYTDDISTEKPISCYEYEVTQLDSDKIVVEVNIPETAGADDTMYVAVYDASNKIICVYVVNNIESVNSFDSPANAEYVRVFMWNNMKPLT